IDQSFVRGATQPGSRNGAIIASITSLAQSLKMDTTAEGVETHDELDLVRQVGCSHVQGFIYDAPLDFTSATSRLQSGTKVQAYGPRSAREPRQKVLRHITLDHQGEMYNGTIRNISETGALIEGLWNVPPGTYFTIHIADDFSIGATSRWSEGDRLGVEFEDRLRRDSSGRFLACLGLSPKPVPIGPLQRTSCWPATTTSCSCVRLALAQAAAPVAAPRSDAWHGCRRHIQEAGKRTFRAATTR